MSSPTFKVVHIRWWHKPVPLAKKTPHGLDLIGWVWNQRAYLVKNLHHGWIAFVDDQTPENIDHWFCRHCGASVWGTHRSRIETATKDTP
jgi:hypothetical protein